MVSMLEEFNTSTQKLYDSTNIMTKAIDDITSATNATTEDVMNIVGDVEHINNNSETLYFINGIYYIERRWYNFK